MDDKYFRDMQKQQELFSKVAGVPMGMSSALALHDSIKGISGILSSPSMLSVINSAASAHKIMGGSMSGAIASLNKVQGLFTAQESVFKSMQYINSVCAMVNSFKSLELTAGMAAASKAFQQVNGINGISELMATQARMIKTLRAFEDADMTDYTLEDVIEVAKPEVLEKQLNFINAQDDSEQKSYLRANLISILSLILTIIVFVWTCCNAKETSKQNEKIISLLEQQNTIRIEELNEEQQQTRLITVQTELLKELIIDINNKVKD